MGLCASSPAPPGAVPASDGSVPEAGAKASPRASLQKDESLAAKPVAGEEAPPGGAGPPASASASDRTRVVLRWRRGPCIGRGGSGAVFVARQPDTGALFAVKEVDLSKQSADAIKDIRTEINTLRRLTHPNIVQYLGSQMRGSTLCILMEWVPGGSARQFLRDMGELPPGVIARYAVQALRGLGWLHSRNVIHCDVKPDNLLLDDNGTVLLADFGAASMRVALGSPVDASQGGGRRVQGSPYYMSPETMRGDAPTPAADIWGLGATVLELATGRPPWSDRGIRDAPSLFVHVTKDASRLPTIPERLPASLRDFLSQCFRRDPSSRPSAVALLAHPFVASTSARVPVARMASRMASVLPDLGEGPQGSAATGTSGARPGGGHRLAASLSLAVVAEFSQPPSAAPGRANDSLAPQSGAGSAGGTDSSALRRILMRAQSNAGGPGIDGPAAQPAGGFARGSSVMRGSLGYGRMMSRVDSVGMAQALGGGAGGSGQPTSTFLAFDSRMRSVMVGDELAGHTGSGSRGRSSGDPAAQGTYHHSSDSASAPAPQPHALGLPPASPPTAGSGSFDGTALAVTPAAGIHPSASSGASSVSSTAPPPSGPAQRQAQRAQHQQQQQNVALVGRLSFGVSLFGSVGSDSAAIMAGDARPSAALPPAAAQTSAGANSGSVASQATPQPPARLPPLPHPPGDPGSAGSAPAGSAAGAPQHGAAGWGTGAAAPSPKFAVPEAVGIRPPPVPGHLSSSTTRSHHASPRSAVGGEGGIDPSASSGSIHGAVAPDIPWAGGASEVSVFADVQAMQGIRGSVIASGGASTTATAASAIQARAWQSLLGDASDDEDDASDDDDAEGRRRFDLTSRESRSSVHRGAGVPSAEAPAKRFLRLGSVGSGPARPAGSAGTTAADPAAADLTEIESPAGGAAVGVSPATGVAPSWQAFLACSSSGDSSNGDAADAEEREAAGSAPDARAWRVPRVDPTPTWSEGMPRPAVVVMRASNAEDEPALQLHGAGHGPATGPASQAAAASDIHSGGGIGVGGRRRHASAQRVAPGPPGQQPPSDPSPAKAASAGPGQGLSTGASDAAAGSKSDETRDALPSVDSSVVSSRAGTATPGRWSPHSASSSAHQQPPGASSVSPSAHASRDAASAAAGALSASRLYHPLHAALLAAAAAHDAAQRLPPAAPRSQSRKREEPLFVDASGALLAGTVDDTLPDVDWEMEGDDAPELGVAAQRGGGAPRLSPAGAGRASAKPGRSRSSGSVPGPRVDTGRRSRLAQSGSTDVAPGAAGTAARGGASLRQFGSAMGQSVTGSVSTADGAASLDGVALASNSQSSPALAGRSGRAGSTSGSDNPRAAGETADAPAPKSSPMLITGAASRSTAARSMRRGRSRASGDGSRSREVANDDEEDEDETTSEDDSEREDRPDEEWAAEARSRRDLVGVSKDEEAAAQALGDRDPRASTVFNLDDIMEDGAGGSADEADARDPALESGATEMGSRLDAPFVSGISGSQTTRHDASLPRIADGGSPLATPRVAAPGHWASSSASKMAKDSKAPSSSSSEFHLAVTAGQASGLGSSLRLSTSTNGDGQRRSGGGTSASPASHLGEGDTLGSRRAAPFGPSPALPHMAMMRSGSVHARPQLDAVPESRSKPVAVQQLGDVRSRSAKAVFRNAPDEVAEAALRGYMQARAKNVLAVAFGQGWTDDGNPVLYDNSELLRKFAAEADGGEAASAAVPPRPS